MGTDASGRITQRRRLLKTARIAFNAKSSVVNCVLRNRSETGAGVRLDGPVPIPDHVQLIIENEIIDCRKVWQQGLNVGLAFG